MTEFQALHEKWLKHDPAYAAEYRAMEPEFAIAHELIRARVFGNTADFWLSTQRRTDVWQALHDPKDRKRIDRARPLEVMT